MSAAAEMDLLAQIVPPSRAPRVRCHTTSMTRLSKRELERGRAEANTELRELQALIPAEALVRPRTWGECQERGLGTETPCPFVSCKYHLYLDVNERTGSIKLNFPDREIEDLPETCSLAVAERGAQILESVGATMNLTRERIRQLETRILARVTPRVRALGLTPEGHEVSRPDLHAAAMGPLSCGAIRASAVRLVPAIRAAHEEAKRRMRGELRRPPQPACKREGCTQPAALQRWSRRRPDDAPAPELDAYCAECRAVARRHGLAALSKPKLPHAAAMRLGRKRHAPGPLAPSEPAGTPNEPTSTEQIALCGNSVCPPVAEALVRANLTRAVPARRVA